MILYTADLPLKPAIKRPKQTLNRGPIPMPHAQISLRMKPLISSDVCLASANKFQLPCTQVSSKVSLF